MKHFSKHNLETLEYATIGTNKKVTYFNLECGFDIETTSEIIQGKKVAYSYMWTMGFGSTDEHIYYGRTWEELKEFISQIKSIFKFNQKRRLIVYVHNLGYEFQFMRKYFEWAEVFAIGERKPLKALTTDGLEFRDNYLLSGYSLDGVAKNLTKHKVEKMIGDLDYSLTRHHKTPLTDEELGYCRNDVLIILYYINEQIELYGDITKIPLTNTGRVRKYVRHNCYYTNTDHKKSSKGKFLRYRKLMKNLTVDEDIYSMLKRAFMGGFTHANANRVGEVIEDVTSIDFSSSYPSVMVAERFPMSKGERVVIKNEKEFRHNLKHYCMLFDIKFVGLRSKIQQDNYLSESKCGATKNAIINNGRIYSADEISTTLTDIDFHIMEMAYEWEEIYIGKTYRFTRGYLPKDIIKSVIELYGKKTTLKDVEGKEVEYMLSKGMLNSVYGMSVTDVVREDIDYIDEWFVSDGNVGEQIDDYNKSYSRFLYYPWGVWITAYARMNLWIGIISIGGDYIYSDTDSIKFTNYDKHKPYIERHNELITHKTKLMCKHYGFDYDLLRPKTIEGKEKPIGVWDFDGHYKRFKTLGAKRYLVEYDNDKMETTIAGLSKSNGIKYLQQISNDNIEVFEKFNDEMYIPEEHTGKMTHTYIDEKVTLLSTDYLGNTEEVHTKSGVHLGGCDFTLSLAVQFKEFLGNLVNGYMYKGVNRV